MIVCDLGTLSGFSSTSLVIAVIVDATVTGIITNEIEVTTAITPDLVGENNRDEPTTMVLDTDMDGIPDFADEDDDNDGIPDEDEERMGMNPRDAADAGKDWDNDGYSNLEEYIAGTVHTNAGSFFQLFGVDVERVGMGSNNLFNVTFTFNTVSGRFYHAEYTAVLSEPWSICQSNVFGL